MPSPDVVQDALNREDWKHLGPHCHSQSLSALRENSSDMILLRGGTERKPGPERGLGAASLLWSSAANITYPLQSMKASQTVCKSDSLFPSREKCWSPAMTGQPCYRSSYSCRETGLLMVLCIYLWVLAFHQFSLTKAAVPSCPQLRCSCQSCQQIRAC